MTTETTPGPDSLTLAEALALRDGERADGRLALKLTLLEMLADGVLTLPPDDAPAPVSAASISRSGGRPALVTTNPYVVSARGNAVRRWSAGHQHRKAIVLILKGGTPPGKPLPFRHAALAIREQFGADASGFVANCLLPDLVTAGGMRSCATPARRGLFGWRALLFGEPPPRYGRTARGAALLHAWSERLAAAGMLAEDFEGPNAAARRDDRDGIALLAAAAGPALLLLDGDFQAADLRRIRRALSDPDGRLSRLLEAAERHGRRLDRGLMRLSDGIDSLTPGGYGYSGAGNV